MNQMARIKFQEVDQLTLWHMLLIMALHAAPRGVSEFLTNGISYSLL